MATTVADLVANLRVDAGQFTRGMQTAGRESEGFGKKLTTVGNALKAAMGAAAVKMVLNFGAELFKLGVQAEAWGRRFDTVFGSAGGALRKWAEESSRSFGMSSQRLEGLLSGIGDLLVPMGMTRDAAAEMSKEMAEVGNALSLWVGGQRSAEEVARIMGKAMLGEREALKELGVSITEAEVQAGLLAAGFDNLTGKQLQQAKAQVTWQLIQDKSVDAITAYESGLTDAAKAQLAMAAAMDDLKVRAGELTIRLGPMVLALAEFVGLATQMPSYGVRDIQAGMAAGGRFSLRGNTNAAHLAAQQSDMMRRQAALAARRGVSRQAGAEQLVGNLGGIFEGIGSRLGGSIAGTSQSIIDAIATPFEAARNRALAAVQGMSVQVGNIISGIPDQIPQLNLSQLVQNALQIARMEQEISSMLAQAGQAGLDAFVDHLSRLSPEQQFALSQMGFKAWSIINSAASGQQWGYNPNTGTWGATGGAGTGGGTPDIQVNFDTFIGDELAVARSVRMALRRAKLRGGA